VLVGREFDSTGSYEYIVNCGVSKQGFPNPKPVFLATFYYPKPIFFNHQTRVFQKTWNYCCIQILVILITLKLQIGACNGQISTFELSAMIMRHEVRVLLGDHRAFVVGPFIFSLS